MKSIFNATCKADPVGDTREPACVLATAIRSFCDRGRFLAADNVGDPSRQSRRCMLPRQHPPQFSRKERRDGQQGVHFRQFSCSITV